MHLQSSAASRQLPVFVFPHSITFYLDDQSTHKQILTLYNPYDFPVKFRVLSTATEKYVVFDSVGTIRSKYCIDIVIRHTALTPMNCTVDKFEIKMYEYPTNKLIGIRQVKARVMSGVPEPLERVNSEADIFQQLPNTGKNQKSYSLVPNKTVQQETNYVAVLVGVICIIGLLLPSEGEPSNRIPDYLHLSINIRLILSFVLGMVTIICLRL